MRHGLKIRNDIPGYMAELRRWLQTTEVDGLEEMAAFFSARLDCYEDHMSRWQEAYRHMASLVPPDARTLLDLGCGTGLELDALLPLRPDLAVTGVDLSPDMLMRLRLKHPGVQTHCADYFAWELGQARYDAALTFETLHHFTPEKKAPLFSKIYAALHEGGIYLQADYFACCAEEEALLYEVCRAKRLRDNIAPGQFVHFDTPLTLEHEMALLRGAGFRRVEALCCVEGASFLRAKKEG